MIIHIYEAMLVGACTAWITWQVMTYFQGRRTQAILDRLRARQIAHRDPDA